MFLAAHPYYPQGLFVECMSNLRTRPQLVPLFAGYEAIRRYNPDQFPEGATAGFYTPLF